MASHLLWLRLPKGRVWHVACSGAQVALCGQSIPDRGERQPKRPPFGARPCPDCDLVAVEAHTALGMALVNHNPRTDGGPFEHRFGSQPKFYPLGTAKEVHLLTKPSLPACEDCTHTFGNHDSLGVCQDVDENGDACECGEYLAVCHCQHPWALHDMDTGECCFVFVDPDESDDQPTACVCTEFRP